MNPPVFSRFLLLVVLLCGAETLWAQAPECGLDVQNISGTLEVAATGEDDTANIQCALDEAKRLGIPVVRLLRDEYAITQIKIRDFEGTLEGSGQDNTTLVLFDSGIDCAAQIALGEVPSGLKFVRGNVKLARMTIAAANPCIEQENPLFFVVHFTGEPAGFGCANDTGFAQVDRAAVIGIGGNPDVWGIAAMAEGYLFTECNDTLLGTFKLNRALVGGFNTGVVLSLRGSGQADINFSEFSNSFRHVYTENANQLLTVQANDFFSQDLLDANHTSIEIYSRMGTPSQNRAVVFRNRFNLVESDNGFSISGVAVFKDEPVNLSLVVSDNRLEVNAPFSSGVYVEDVDGANISGNRFIGTPDTGIFLLGGGSGSTLTANNFNDNQPGFADIYLNPSTSGVITALNLNVLTVDDGSGNIVLGEPLQQTAPERIKTAESEPGDQQMVSRSDLVYAQASAALLKTGISKEKHSPLPMGRSIVTRLGGALNKAEDSSHVKAE